MFVRTRFNDGHLVDGQAGVVNGKKYETTPNILQNKDDYEFLQWEFELGDCVFFDMRTLHGNLNEITPKNDVHRYTLRMAKEDSKIEYRGDWAKEEREIMVANGYQKGDDLDGKMFPTLYKESRVEVGSPYGFKVCIYMRLLKSIRKVVRNFSTFSSTTAF